MNTVVRRGWLNLQKSRWATSLEQLTRAFSSDGDGLTISVDRSGLILPRGDQNDSYKNNRAKNASSELVKHISSLIQFRGGPLTLAEYMHEVLTHPTEGYYTTKAHVFGSKGDFITSPDISQMFGEMIGIWCVAMWEQLGCPKELRVVELGPGKGTLMADFLRGTMPFLPFHKALSVCLVEVSPRLQELQKEALAEFPSVTTWYTSLEDVPVGTVPTLYIGHEFLDAMPIHQFVKKDGSWHEAVVDVADDGFRLVLSPYDTFAAKTVLPSRLRDLGKDRVEALDAIEISPACIGLAMDLTRRIQQHGGAALLIDYGQDGPYENSLVAIKDHEFVDILSEPGKVDLSAYVDFEAMRHGVSRASPSSNVSMHGPIHQSVFLKALGIDSRLHMLIEASEDEKQRESLLSGYKRLVGETTDDVGGHGMGSRYKVIAISGTSNPPIAF